MLHLKHYGKIVNGKRIYYNDDLHTRDIQSLEGREFEEIIKLRHKPVSKDAFGYYYGGVIGTALKAEMFGGWDADDVDEFFSDMFLSYPKTLRTTLPNGSYGYRTIRKVESKGQSFSSKKMSEFTDKVITWLAGNGIIVPPSEQWHLGKYKTENRGSK